MAKKVEIQANLANLLTYIGSLYRNPADAMKEYVSNALDEWQKGDMATPCEVDCRLEHSKIVITCNQPGMDEREFRDALQRVADSAKPGLGLPQIGQLGIGLFAFNQVGRKCTFLSKKGKNAPTVKVVLSSNSDEAQFDTALRREALEVPGTTITIEQLLHDPLKPRSNIGFGRLQGFFADRFDHYLNSGSLTLTIHAGDKESAVRPREVKLKSIGSAFSKVRLQRTPSKAFACTLWFDPLGKSTVAIRHTGLPIVEDVKTMQAYGLEGSVFGSGYVRGYIDADFLKPQPARTSFVEDDDWINFLDTLDSIRPSLEKEVADLRKERERHQLTGLQRMAIQIAADILSSPEFQDLAPLGGLRLPHAVRPTKAPAKPMKSPKPGKPPHLPKEPGKKRRGGRINLEEVDFTDETQPDRLHCRFLSGKVQVNKLNQDFQREMAGTEPEKLAYATLMIGKETIAYDDVSKASNEHLEKLLTFLFQAKGYVGRAATTGLRARGRSGKSPA